MTFDKALPALTALKGKETVTVEDFLGIFSDLCQDAKVPEKLPSENIRLLTAYLCSIRRTLDRIYLEHEKEFEGTYRERLASLHGTFKKHESLQDLLALTYEELGRENEALKKDREKLAALQNQCRQLLLDKKALEEEIRRSEKEISEAQTEIEKTENLSRETRKRLDAVLEKQKNTLKRWESEVALLHDAWHSLKADRVFTREWAEGWEAVQAMETVLNQEMETITKALGSFRDNYRMLSEKLSR